MRSPEHKDDMQALQALRTATERELEPLVPELLSWLQDMNWPVARPVSEILARCGAHLVEPVREVLLSSDDIWKYWILTDLLREVAPSVRAALRQEISRIATNPTPGEVAEWAAEAAEEVLTLMECDGAAES